MTAKPNPEAATDAVVVAARTDREAFGRLYDIYHTRIFGYCLRRLAARTAAEDATANVFLQVASHLPTFPGRTAEDFQRWLYRIAINEVNATIRKRLRRQRHWEQVKHAKAPVDGDGEGAGGRSDSLSWPTLHEAIARLSSREQTIVVLRFYQGMSHEEIGHILDRRPATVRVALSRAISKLRKELAEFFEENCPVSESEQPT